MSVRIEASAGPGVRVLTLRGPLTYPEGTAHLRSTVRARIEAGDRDFVIDLTDVPFIDSAGIGEVVASYKRARERGGVVRLAMQARRRETFTYCHLDRMFDIDDSAEAALARFGATAATGGGGAPRERGQGPAPPRDVSRT